MRENPFPSHDLSTSQHIRRAGSRTKTEQFEILWRISDLDAVVEAS
jgi:hypothetical protein